MKAAVYRGPQAVAIESAPEPVAPRAGEITLQVERAAICDLVPIVVDKTIPLGALVEEGLRPLAERTARGKILVDPRR